MSKEDVILRFDSVKFHYDEIKPILKDVSFSVRKNSKITIMGPNGAGKSTMFKLITKDIEPTEGRVLVSDGASVAIAKQTMADEYMEMTVREYFATAFDEKKHNLDKLVTNRHATCRNPGSLTRA